MERRETISIKIDELWDCIRKKLLQEFPYLDDEDVIEVNLLSNTKFLLYEVIRRHDKTKDSEVKG